jgi:hypothetical protein
MDGSRWLIGSVQMITLSNVIPMPNILQPRAMITLAEVCGNFNG